MTLTASVVVDLSTSSVGDPGRPWRSDRERVLCANLPKLPDGTRVLLLVGSRDNDATDSWVLQHLVEHERRLSFDVCGSSASAIAHWHRVIRRGGFFEEAVA